MDDIKRKLFKATRNITETSGQFLKNAKLSIALNTEEENLRNTYIDIGKKVHEIYLYGGSLGKFFDEKYLEIEAIQEKIDTLKTQIDGVKGTKICPHCNSPVEKSGVFCSKCGYSMNSEIVMPQAEIKALPVELYSNIKICSICNTQNDQTSKFCAGCGRYMA